MTDREFNKRVHDAYESLGPTDDAHDRVLAALREAQDARESRELQEPQARQPVFATRMTRVVLPLAACLVVAITAVSVWAIAPSTQPSGTNESSAVRLRQEESAYDSDAAKGAAPESAAAPADAAAEKSSAFEDAAEAGSAAEEEVPLAPAERTVTLDDGSTFVLGDALAKTPTWTMTEDAQLWDGEQTAPCQVADRQFVYVDEDGLWYELVDQARQR